MNTHTKQTAYLHYTMAFIGGFFGLYTIITRCDLLGAAQTANLFFLVRSLLGGNFIDILLRLGGLLLYCLGILLTVWLPFHTRFNIQILSILIDGIAALILGFLPQDMNPVVAIYPVFFAMAFQWCCFRGIDNCVSATTFSTNNLRQFLTAAFEYLTTKDLTKRIRMQFYGCTLAAFHIGAAMSCIAQHFFHMHSIWFLFLPIAAALFQAAYATDQLSVLLPLKSDRNTSL